MKTLITVTNPDLKRMLFNDETISKLKSFSEVGWLEEGGSYSSADLASIISPYDACITSWGSPKLTAEVLQEAPKLKFIGHAAGSVVSIVNEDVYDRDITVTNANKLLGHSTAEAAVACMLGGAWNMKAYSQSLMQGKWTINARETVLGLTYRTVGLIGLGEISRQVIRMIKAFSPRILLYSRYCSEEEAAELGVEVCSLSTLLRKSDIVSLHSTWTPATEGMIGSAELSQMRDGALLINTARGAIIDEEALIQELKSGRIQAVLDVYKQEPLNVDSPLLQMPNVWCLPHIGGFHGLLKSGMGGFVIDDLQRVIQGEQPRGLITREIYKRLTPS
jgi:phosphoglycerate dehydrogenase-like enzyme